MARAGFRPRLEILENRLAPSCSVLQVDSDANGSLDTLQIIGDDGKQAVDIVARSGNTYVTLDCNRDGDYLDPGELDHADLPAFETIDIRLAGGKDKVMFLPGGIWSQRSLTALVDMGSGDDRFTLRDGNHPFEASHFRLQLQTGDGNDNIFTDDTPFLNNGSSYEVEMLLGSGNNNAALNFDTDMSQDSTWNVSIEGSSLEGDVDTVFARFNGNVRDTAQAALDVALGAGNDSFTADFITYFNLLGGEVQLNVDGGEGDDTLAVTGDDKPNGNGLDLHAPLGIHFQGGAGNDTINVDFINGDGMELDGNFVVNVDGGAGSDTVSVYLLNTATSRGNYDVTIQGGGDDDSLTLVLNAPAPIRVKFYNSTTADPLDQVVLLDGGDGTDQCTVTISAGVPLLPQNCEL